MFMRGQHLDEFRMMQDVTTNNKPTHYNTFLDDQKLLTATTEQIAEIARHFTRLEARIKAAEQLGQLILTDQYKRFPRVNDKLYEPEGTDWICPPVYADPNHFYW